MMLSERSTLVLKMLVILIVGSLVLLVEITVSATVVPRMR